MLNNTYLKTLKKQLHEYALIRREVITHAGNALHLSKRAIFSMHRKDLKEAKQKIAAAEKMFKTLQKKYKKTPEITGEGAYRAGVEEYVEASLLYQFLTTGKLGKITGLGVDRDVYLAGLCDVPGELYRYAVRAATERDTETVQKCVEAGAEIIGALVEFDLTKYLRTKYDQAKKAHQKLEIVQYELSLRK